MRLVTATVWTNRRKWLGNLIPAIFWFPPAAIALYRFAAYGQLSGPVLWPLAVSTVLGWLAVNRFGLFENAKMRGQLEVLLKRGDRDLSGDPVFVGFATPKYSSLLDAHEDVGFLYIRPDSLVFISESRTIEIQKADVAEIRPRMNVHSVVGLGRWVSIEGRVGNRPIRLQVEPRDRPTLLGNRLNSGKLIAELRAWRGPGG